MGAIRHIRPLETIEKFLILVKSSFWRQFLSRLLAYPFGYVLVGTARTGQPVLKIVAKITDFRRTKNLAIVSQLFSFLLLLVGCQQKNWIYREVISDCPRFNSALLSCLAKNPFDGIEIQFLKGEFGLLGFLNVFSREILSDTIYLKIEEYHYTFSGIVMEGHQRLLLPESATQMILSALVSGKSVLVCLQGYSTVLLPENFSKYFTQFNRPLA